MVIQIILKYENMKKYIINSCCVFFAVSFLNFAGVRAQEKKDSTVIDLSGSRGDSLGLAQKKNACDVAFGKVAKQDLLGGVSIINLPELLKKSHSTYSFNFQSLVGGYNDGGIWGQGGYLVLVDGAPTSTSDVLPSEVESISILKGANAVVLYGSRAAKGVILVTTKRGGDKPLDIDISANTGLYVPKSYPKYLNSADYMTLYNEAYTNDGLATSAKPLYYTQDLIDNTQAGTNPYQYPDIDFFNSDYLKKTYNRTSVISEISGSNQFAHYYSNLGMDYYNSLLKFGNSKDNNNYRFNVRANIDMKLSNWLTASTDVAVVMYNAYRGNGDFWGSSSTMHPNWYGGSNATSPLIPISMLDPNNSALQTIVNNSTHVVDGKYLLAGNSSNLTNVFSDMSTGGYIKSKNRTFMFNVKLAADLSSLLKGLSFKTLYSVDYLDFYTESYSVAYAVYQPTWSTVDGKAVITGLTQYNNDKATLNESVGNSTLYWTMSSTSQFNYNRTFGQFHNVSVNLIGWGYQNQQTAGNAAADANLSQIHRTSNLNLGLQANYNYKNRYYFDFSAAEAHSAKLPLKNRNAFSPAVTLGWRISDEDFFKNKVSFVENLKLTASYANLHQDIDITDGNSTAKEYYLYQGYYYTDNNTSWVSWRDNAVAYAAPISGRGSNPDLTYVQRNEFRMGLEASLLKNLITLDANYFLQYTNGTLTQGLNQTYPSYFGTVSGSNFAPWLNYNNDKRSGIDFSLNLNKRIGEIDYSLGFCGMYYSSEATKRDELYVDKYRNRAGKPLDSYWGYICEGFFTDQADIASHQSQSALGVQKPGDLKYKDVNGDGIINEKDQVNLGHNGWYGAPFTYGINFTVKWKNVTLYAMGTGQSGAIGFKNSSYYWVKGSSKFSDVVQNRWTDATKETATYPRLTTTDNNNNYQNSTFWMYKTNRFDLKRVQISYDLPADIFKNSYIHALNLYVSGDDLLTISKERKLMETNIGSAPQCRYFSIGAKVSF
jgi:TonB-linked SusC/RagA family outer membrane protein